MKIIVCELFTGLLGTGEKIGECHACGRQVRRDAGITEGMVSVRLRCLDCASGRFPAVPDPRRGDGCVCGRPLRCGCGLTCLLCYGTLPP